MATDYDVLLSKPAIFDDLAKPINSIDIKPTAILEPPPIPPTHLAISPYTDLPHLLNLATVSLQEQLLAHALVKMESVREDYARAPYVDSFNWPEVIADLRQRAEAINHKWSAQEFYIVAFRSQIPPTTNYGDLGDLDKAAHKEAIQSGGFLK